MKKKVLAMVGIFLISTFGFSQEQSKQRPSKSEIMKEAAALVNEFIHAKGYAQSVKIARKIIIWSHGGDINWKHRKVEKKKNK